MTRRHCRCAALPWPAWDFSRARLLLRRAAAFGSREGDRCARCVTVRRVDPQSGEVLELIEMPQGVRRIGP
jgi:hypothetical protein